MSILFQHIGLDCKHIQTELRTTVKCCCFISIENSNNIIDPILIVSLFLSILAEFIRSRIHKSREKLQQKSATMATLQMRNSFYFVLLTICLLLMTQIHAASMNLTNDNISEDRSFHSSELGMDMA